MRGPAALCAVLSGIVLATLAPSETRAQDAASAPAAAPGDDAADREEVARQHFQLGRAQYESGSFRDAAQSFERAYELSQREVLWYNIYLAYRDAGDNVRAANALRNYLTRVAQVENRPHLEARLANLDRLVQEEAERARREQAAAEAQAAEPAGAGSEPAPPTPAPDAATASAPQDAGGSSSILPYVLLGTGGAMIAGGVVTGLMASSKHAELEDECPDGRCDPSLKSVADEGQTLALVADVLLFGGLAVAGAGGVLWFLNREASDESDGAPSATVSCGVRGCGARVHLAF